MLTFGPIAFTAPWLLLGLIVLPILWFLLRAVPPAPIRRRFPGVALLLGLKDADNETDKTPWWLLLLRMLAVAAIILGFAGPVLNPETKRAGTGPLLILMDATWVDARDWPRRQDRISDLLSEAARNGRTAAVVALTDLPEAGVPFRAALDWQPRLPSFAPQPYLPNEADVLAWADALDGGFETFWLSDGMARAEREPLLAALEARGPVTVFESPRPIVALRPVSFEGDVVRLSLARALSGAEREVTVNAMGLDPAGVERVLAKATARFESGDTAAEVEVSLPSELRNRMSRFEIEGLRSAGGVTLTDDSLRRREVALIDGGGDREGLELLSPTHYLQQALEPTADLIDGALSDVLLANPDVIVFADVARVGEGEEEDLLRWIAEGGLLLRFAGPRLAASDVARVSEDALLPVRLRSGGRSVGGTMSWGEPKGLRQFSQGSPFFGLRVPDDVRVSAQVMAEPDPELSDRVIASLADGTPMVTRKQIGDGQIVLFHVTANAEWSTLPLSGLFVQMLERMAVSTRPARPSAEDLAGTTWAAVQVLDGFGHIEPAGNVSGIAGEILAEGVPDAALLPGLYSDGDRRIAVNTVGAETEIAATVWPNRIPVEGLATLRERALKGVLLAAAIGLLMIDILASLFLSGRLVGPRASAASLILATVLALPSPGQAQGDDSFALAATADVTLAHVLTGDDKIDRVAKAGLAGLADTLFRRTSVEPAPPISLDLETDELSFFPFLYWPVTPDQPRPSSEAYAKLNRYLRSGGMILFDTRDADFSRFGGGSPNGKKLQQLARPLNIPPLEPIPEDHVLTRTFYLLQDFPGRHASRDVWVEAAPADAEQVEGMPFRNLNDGVTPVVIGGNDWASAWAIDARGNRLLPVGRGFAGERQREVALRFGVNLVMHVLTGNYKSDQVHVPALLDRLGN